MTHRPLDVRDQLALVLDAPDLDEAERLAEELAEWFGVVKIGLELYSVAGPRAIDRLQARGFDVFCDLKLHDIPTTVGRAARVLGGLGVRYLNFHAAGGEAMVRAGVEGLMAGASERGHAAPVALGVTVLTSDTEGSAFDERLRVAIEAGCGGVVCSVQEVARVRRARPDLVTVVPGIRLADGDQHDQVRVGTPDEVAAAGADVLVVGRAVTAAPDRADAAARVYTAVARVRAQG
ncbi:MAG: orotidine-5'-phosphate decarboxylase [Actinomycetota bacterium]